MDGAAPFADGLPSESSFEDPSPQLQHKQRSARQTCSSHTTATAPNDDIPEFGGDDSIFGDSEGTSGETATRTDSHTQTLADSGTSNKNRKPNFNSNFAKRRTGDVEASIGALPSVIEDRQARIQYAIDQLQTALDSLGERLPKCQRCSHPLETTEARFDVTLVAQDFIRRRFSAPKYTRCTNMDCVGHKESGTFSPLCVGYFPANPVMQVCEPDIPFLLLFTFMTPAVLV